MSDSLRLGGLIPIVPTPFDVNGAVDLPALDRLLDYLISTGVHGVAVLGMASEAITLTDAERDRIVAAAADRVAGRVPLVTGCSHISPQAVSQLAGAMERGGADVVMVMPPSLGNPDEAALADYFEAAADGSALPVMIQDNPGWHGVRLSLPLYQRLARHDNIRYAKIETQHPPTSLTAVAAAVGDRLTLLGGQAGIWLPEELRRGIAGFMPAAIMPQVYGLVWRLWQQGRRDDAVAVFDRYYPLIRVTGTPRVGIPMAKAVLRAVGVLDHDVVRAPFPPLSATDHDDLQAVLDRLKIVQIMRGELEPEWADQPVATGS